jgi:hypothetical protein
MISGMLNVEEYQLFSHGRVSGCDAKNLLFNCGVMDGRAEETSPVLTGPEVRDCKFSNAVERSQRIERSLKKFEKKK